MSNLLEEALEKYEIKVKIPKENDGGEFVALLNDSR